MTKKNKTWPTWRHDDKSVVSCTEKIKVMSDYLRARVDALQHEVKRLEQRVEFLEAQIEVAKEAMFNKKYQEL